MDVCFLTVFIYVSKKMQFENWIVFQLKFLSYYSLILNFKIGPFIIHFTGLKWHFSGLETIDKNFQKMACE